MPHLCFFGFSLGKGQAELRKQMQRKLWRNKSSTVSQGRSGLGPVLVALEIGSFPPSCLLHWLLLGGQKHLVLVRGRGGRNKDANTGTGFFSVEGIPKLFALCLCRDDVKNEPPPAQLRHKGKAQAKGL